MIQSLYGLLVVQNSNYLFDNKGEVSLRCESLFIFKLIDFGLKKYKQFESSMVLELY
jgi:hypothetical protein